MAAKQRMRFSSCRWNSRYNNARGATDRAIPPRFDIPAPGVDIVSDS